MKQIAAAMVLWFGAAAVPALAHHSFAAEFDAKQPITLEGVVTRIQWNNPHTWFYIDVKTQSGTVEHWQCETGAPIELVRRGWRKNDLKVGDQVTVHGFRAKDGTNTANARLVTLPNGKKVFSGSADDGGPATHPESGTTHP